MPLLAILLIAIKIAVYRGKHGYQMKIEKILNNKVKGQNVWNYGELLDFLKKQVLHSKIC